MESLKGYRTVIFAVLVFVLALANFFGFSDFQMPAEWQKVYELALPLVFLGLRYLSDSAIFKSK